MSDPDKNETNVNQDSVTYFSAASAGVAQSIGLGSQNIVEELRNQGIIKTTVMGATYAKWLANPQAGEQLFRPVIDSISTDPQLNVVKNQVKEFVNLTLSPSPAAD